MLGYLAFWAYQVRARTMYYYRGAKLGGFSFQLVSNFGRNGKDALAARALVMFGFFHPSPPKY